MSRNTEINLTELHDAIVADIRAAFPIFKTVQFYRGEETGEERKNLPLPACLLELTEFEVDDTIDPGTEQLSVVASFEAEIVIGFRTERAKHTIRLLAAGLASWLRLRRFTDPKNPEKKLPTGPALVVGGYKDDFSARVPGQREQDLDQFEVWRVEWRQVLHLGESAIKDDGIVPEALYSWAPEIGIPHKDSYKPIDDVLPPFIPSPGPEV